MAANTVTRRGAKFACELLPGAGPPPDLMGSSGPLDHSIKLTEIGTMGTPRTVTIGNMTATDDSASVAIRLKPFGWIAGL
jgi:hypothetical protein